ESMLYAAVCVRSQVDTMLNLHSNLAPHLPNAIDCIGGELVTIAVERCDVMGVRRPNDLFPPIALEVGNRHILIVHAPPIAGLTITPCRPTGLHRAICPDHVDLSCRSRAGLAPHA